MHLHKNAEFSAPSSCQLIVLSVYISRAWKMFANLNGRIKSMRMFSKGNLLSQVDNKSPHFESTNRYPETPA